MDFENEMNNVSNAETSGAYITKACVEVVTLKSYKLSAKEHTGVPFIEFIFETTGETKEINSSRLYRVREGDSPEKQEVKNRRIKELLTNARADFTLKGESIIGSALGNKFNALFKAKEFIGVDGNNKNKPELRSSIEYSFSSDIDSPIKGNQSYLLTKLSPEDENKLNEMLNKWNRENPENATQGEVSQGNAAPPQTETKTKTEPQHGVQPVESDDDDAFS